MKNRIVVIDSGIKLYPEFPAEIITGGGIKYSDDGELTYIDNYEDEIGHGTAIVDMLLKTTKTFKSIFCMKIYGNEVTVDLNVLIYALEYIYENIECDFILISSGVTYCDKYNELYDVIYRLYRKGVWVVSACDNDGAISFPAAFDSVIGIAISNDSNNMYRIMHNSNIDVIVPNTNYRLRWVQPERIIVKGSSFAAPFIAAVMSEIKVQEQGLKANKDKRKMLHKLADKLGGIIEEFDLHKASWIKAKEFVGKIERAVVFPWNKEIHSLVRYRNLLPFDIVGYYDIKYNLKIGRDVGELIEECEKVGDLENIDYLDWDGDFDTVICGHCGEISNLCKKDFLGDILDKCQKHNKRLYAFDLEMQKKQEIHKYNVDLFVPGINKFDIPKHLDARLYSRITPVLGVFGTSSKQGKFTVQMALKDIFLKQGYNVGQISSEPSGYLLGCDAVFPYGYNANIEVNNENSVYVLNDMLWTISENDTKDIIIVGGQSGTVPYSCESIAQINFEGFDFLCGTNPDVYVLCVNPHDSIEYIERTVKFLEAINGMPVVSILVFPLKYESISKVGYGYRQRRISQDEFYELKTAIKDKIKVPTYMLGEENCFVNVFNDVVNALSE